MAEQQQPHKLVLENRAGLTMTGVTEVLRFEESAVVLRTDWGKLLVQGQGLKLRQLSAEGGRMAVDGKIQALIYEQPSQARGWLGRLFG